jgi:hypothetical protein
LEHCSEDRVRTLDLLEQLDGRNRQRVEDTRQQISELKVDIKSALETLGRDLDEAQSEVLRELIYANHAQRIDIDPGVDATTSHATKPLPSPLKGLDTAISLAVLDSLSFKDMRYRHNAISDPHPGTFAWFFDNKFHSWLRSSDPIFWISGKPGSGKSTLMKYLISTAQKSDSLRRWSDTRKLVIADYFFWVNGTELQRSLEGLLRALLHEILRQHPNLIAYLLPEAWRSASRHISNSGSIKLPWHSPEWTCTALLKSVQRLSTVKNLDANFLIFIDGLDEYDGHFEDLIQTTRYLMEVGVKLCIASRPWNVFEEVFGSDASRKLYLEDFNRGDIQRYVVEKLGRHFSSQRIDLAEADEIVTEIVGKSQGVFLWVRLTVRSLEEGLRNRDSLSLLRKRLAAFPSDLDQFFRHMFTSLDVIYRAHLSHMFQIALAAFAPLSTIAYYYLDVISEDPDHAMSMPAHILQPWDSNKITEDQIVRINGRSKGLLEVTKIKANRRITRHKADYIETRVDFLHRTVKDFITTTEIQKMIADWQQVDFCPHTTLCKVILAEFKCVALTSRAWQVIGLVNTMTAQFFISAHNIEMKYNISPIAYIEEFESVRLASPLREKIGENNPVGLSELAHKYGLYIYLAEKKKQAATTGSNEVVLNSNATVRKSRKEDGNEDQTFWHVQERPDQNYLIVAPTKLPAPSLYCGDGNRVSTIEEPPTLSPPATTLIAFEQSTVHGHPAAFSASTRQGDVTHDMHRRAASTSLMPVVAGTPSAPRPTSLPSTTQNISPAIRLPDITTARHHPDVVTHDSKPETMSRRRSIFQSVKALYLKFK